MSRVEFLKAVELVSGVPGGLAESLRFAVSGEGRLRALDATLFGVSLANTGQSDGGALFGQDVETEGVDRADDS